MIGVSYWAFFGTIYLILLSYQDIKNNRNVDERKNYFMFGLTIALISHINFTLWLVLAYLVIIFILGYLANKVKLLGEADIQSLAWIFYGLMLINVWGLVLFVVIFSIASLTYVLFKKLIVKTDKPSPFYLVILFSYVLACIGAGVY
jgi:hypothetical protein